MRKSFLVAATALAAMCVLLVPGVASAHLSRKDKARISHAYRLYKHGHKAKARRVMRKVRHRGRIPLRRRNHTPCGAGGKICKAAIASSHGCGVASGSSSWEVDFIGADVFKASISQRWCWKKGRVTSFGRPQVTGDVTGFGELINFSYEGVIERVGRWRRWHGKRHGERQTARALRFHACTPIPTGCIFGNDHDVAVALSMGGNGLFGYGQGGS